MVKKVIKWILTTILAIIGGIGAKAVTDELFCDDEIYFTKK